MGVLFTEFNYTPVGGPPLAEVMEDVTKIQITQGAEGVNNTMTVEVSNPATNISNGVVQHKWVDSTGLIRFQAVKASKGTIYDEEVIDVYAHHEDSDATLDVGVDSYLVMSGVIVEGQIQNPSTPSIQLKCKDRTILALDKLTVPQAYEAIDTAAPNATGWTAPDIIQKMIRLSAKKQGGSAKSFDVNGTASNQVGGFLIDARTFTEGVKGTFTAGTSTTGRTITLDTGDYVVQGVAAGDFVKNTTDNTYCYVLSVDSGTQITVSKSIFDVGEGFQISDGFIQDARPDGTAFPEISFPVINKPLNDYLGKISTTSNTNTSTEQSTGLICKRTMRYFIDKKNRFHWYYPDDTPDYYMSVGTTTAISPDTIGHEIISIKLDNKVRDVINFIIYKAGLDMNGNMIKGYARSQFSGQPNTKDSLRDFSTSVSRAMKDLEVKEGNISQTHGDEYGFPASYSPLPSGSNTPSWDEDGTDPQDATDYNDQFIVMAKRKAESMCKQIFAKSGNPRWGGQIQIRGERIIPGDVINFTSDEHGIKNIKLRVERTSHLISKNGWITTLEVLEDENEQEIGL